MDQSYCAEDQAEMQFFYGEPLMLNINTRTFIDAVVHIIQLYLKFSWDENIKKIATTLNLQMGYIYIHSSIYTNR